MKTKQVHYVAALYLRLSRDDGESNESASITTQKKMLLKYAKENNFSVFDIYSDDGYSGTNFERPEFRRMIEDIEDKKINLVITKDLSRLGRDYIKTGEYTEIYFPLHGIRYIAINDGYDSDSVHTDIAPFKNIVNEMYARDISKKIRSAFHTRMEAGYYIGNFAPYGYKKDPENKNHLIVDEESAAIVQKIFQLAEDGERPKQIAEYLNQRQVLTPVMYRAKNHQNFNPERYAKKDEWTSAKVSKLLKNIVYLGHTAQGKTSKLTLKSHHTIRNSKDDWIIIENTHEPIVSKRTFDRVTSFSGLRKNESKGQFVNLFSGIARCADCGRNMSSTGTRKKGAKANLVCGGYKLYGSKECTNHFIDYDVLYHLVLEDINKQISVTDDEMEAIYSVVKSNINKSSLNIEEQKKRRVSSLRKRSFEIDHIIQHLYEDNLSGKLSDERFGKLSRNYEKEQTLIEESLNCLEQELKVVEDKASDYKKFLELLTKYTKIQELNQDIVHELIDHIEISQGSWIQDEKGKRKIQEVKIFYNFIGNIKQGG